MAILNIKVDISETEDFLEKLIKTGIRKSLNFAVGKSSSFLSSYIIQRHLTGGTTKDRLRVRTGRLRQTTVALIPKIESSRVSGGITFGTKYASTHISAKPKTTTITPKTAKALAIPLPGSPAMTASGVQRGTGSIRQAFPFLSLVKTKNNALLIDTRDGNFIPYFVLKKSIKIDSRVHLDEIINLKEKDIVKIFNNAIKEVIDD